MGKEPEGERRRKGCKEEEKRGRGIMKRREEKRSLNERRCKGSKEEERRGREGMKRREEKRNYWE